MTSEIRASDDDRQRVVELLQHHTERGRLDLDEFSQRVGEAYAARTLADLAMIVGDLPSETGPAENGTKSTPDTQSGRRDLLTVFIVAAATLLLLGLYMAVTR